MGWNPTELHLDAHKYTEETQAGGIGFRVTYPVVVLNTERIRGSVLGIRNR